MSTGPCLPRDVTWPGELSLGLSLTSSECGPQPYLPHKERPGLLEKYR